MKYIILIITLIIPYILSGQVEQQSMENDQVKYDSMQTSIGEDSISNRDAEVNIDLKNRNIRINEENVTVRNKKNEKEYSIPKRKRRYRSFKSFNGHLEGLDISLPLFTEFDIFDERAVITPSPTIDYMNLNTSRSFSVSLNISDQSFGIISDHLGIIIGGAIEWNNYHFDNPVSLMKDPVTGNTIPVDLNVDLKKSKLSTTYLTMPLLLEIQPFGRDGLYISGGVVGGLKIISNTKIVYFEDGEKKKEKEWSDFNLNPLRYGYMVRLGYDEFGVYGLFYPVQLFENGKGPELYPVNIGISIFID